VIVETTLLIASSTPCCNNDGTSLKGPPMNPFFTRHLPKPSPKPILLAGLGGFLGIAVLSFLADQSGLLLIMAPFGASCVLLFAVPASPLSQPANVLGGHILAAAVALGLREIFPIAWWSVALAVGVAIALMVALRVTHPPAGANPLVIFAADPGFLFLFYPVALGAILLVVVATIFHRSSGTEYPLQLK
jgi:CBS-domain-containing membrane protein